MVNPDLPNALGLSGLSSAKAHGNDPVKLKLAFPSLEGFPGILDSILAQADYPTLLTCRQISTYLCDQADKALFDEMPITDLSNGDIVIKSRGRVLPCFHPDSPEARKAKTLAAAIVTTCTAFSHYQALSPLLIEHLGPKGVLIVYGVPLAEGHVKFPKIHALQMTLDLRRKHAPTPSPTIEHESFCVTIDLELPLMEPEHWWKLIPFLRPSSLHCAHLFCRGTPRMSWVNLGPCSPGPGQLPDKEWFEERNDNWHVFVSCPDLKRGDLNEAMRAGVRRSLAIVLASPDGRLVDSVQKSPFRGYEGPSSAVLIAEAQARACEDDADNSEADPLANPGVSPDELIRGCAQQ